MFSLITKPNKACRLEIAGTDDKLGKKKRRQKNDKKKLDLSLDCCWVKFENSNTVSAVDRIKIFS